MNKYVKNFVLSASNTIMMLIFPIITFPYVCRILGTNNLGIINFAQSYGYYFIHIANFGIASYAIREVSKVRDDKAKVEVVANEIFNLNFLFSLVSTFLYFCGVFFFDRFRENFIVFSIYSVVILTNFLSLDWLLQSFDDYLFSTIRNVIIRLLSLVAVFLFIKKPDDYQIYMAILCVSEMGTKISALMYCRKSYARLKIKRRFLNFKLHFKPMFTLFTFRLVNGISSNLDKIMIGFVMIYSSVGVYSAGVKFILMVQPIVETVGIVLFPKINISANSSKEEYLKNLRINYDLILLMGIPMSIGMFLVSGRLIPLFSGDEFIDAIPVSRIMSAMILLGPIGDMLGSKTILVFKKDRWLLISSAITAISNIFFNLVCIPIWGINGAAIASIISVVASVVSRYFFTRKLIKIRLFTKNLLKYFIFCIPFIVLYYIFRNMIDNNSVVMFVFIAVCCLIYATELLISKDYLAKMVISKFIKKDQHA